MSQDVTENQGASLVQSVLQMVASTSDLNSSIETILKAGCQLTQATSAFFVIFHEPEFVAVENFDSSQLVDMDMMRERAEALSSGIHLSASLPTQTSHNYVGSLLSPVVVNEAIVGLCGFLFESEYEADDTAMEWLSSLLDCLTIVTARTRYEARQLRLSRNQYEFMRIVSHDLRSPLASVLGFASMLESNAVGDMNEKQAHFVTKILSGIDQMTTLVDNIQDAGRYDPETGFYEMDRAPTDVLDMIQDIVNNHLLPAEKQELTLKVAESSHIPIINADQTMLERAITNLVDNAIKYTPNGGEIEVGAQLRDENIIISISDNGYGISEEDRKRLFERHFRIRRREHKRVKGSGLGLFIVRSVAQRHGGNAWVESTEGEGSSFLIRIPLEGDNLVGSNPDS